MQAWLPGVLAGGARAAVLAAGVATIADSPANAQGQPGVTCRFVDVAGGSLRSMALGVDGNVWSWSYHKGFGIVVDDPSGIPCCTRLLPWPGPVPTLSAVIALTAGAEHSQVLAADGTIWTWGLHFWGQLGTGPPWEREFFPVPLTGAVPWLAVDSGAGSDFVVAAGADGSVWRWGRRGLGGWAGDSGVPLQLGGISAATAVAAGIDHGLAVEGGTVWAWGDGASGALGDGSDDPSATPVQVLSVTDAVAVSAGYQFSLAVTGDGTLWTWGLNDEGQLGDGTNSSRNVPLAVSLPGPVAEGSAGLRFVLVRLADGTVWAWGANDYGQLGDGGTADSNVPRQVMGLAGIVAVDAGSRHSLAVDRDGAVWAWGADDSYQLGLGPLPGPPWIRPRPVQVDFDAIPPDQGNVLRAVRQASDVFLDWDAGLPFISAARASLWRIYADGDKTSLGTTTLTPDSGSSTFLDVGAVPRSPLEFYRVKGLSRCTETPGP